MRSVSFAIALLIPVVLGNGEITWIQVYSLLSISVLSVLLGRQLACWLGLERITNFSAAFEIISGFSGLSIFLLVLSAVFEFDAIQAFLAAAFMIFALSAKYLKSILTKRRCLADFHLGPEVVNGSVFVFISLLATLWCRELIGSMREAYVTGVFYAWPDIFLHANQILYVENISKLSYQSLYLAGTSQPLYHIAGYALSSFYASANSALTLSVATYFLTPVSIILMGIGVYGLGCSLAGRMAGFLATTAIFLLPDASMYGLKNGAFGFYWLMQTHPGSGYAIGLVLIAIALFVKGVHENRFSFFLSGLVIALSSAAFRVQIAAPAVVMFLLLSIICWSPSKGWHKKAAIGGVFVGVALVVILFESIEFAPHFLTGKYQISLFFDTVHSMATSSYGMTYAQWTAGDVKFYKWIVGYGLFLLAALGFVFPATLFLSAKILMDKKGWRIDIVPAVLILSCFIVIVGLPAPADGDFTNFGHRQFVLLYAVLLTYSAAWISAAYARLIEKWKVHRYISRATVAFSIIAGLAVPWIFGKNIQQPDLRPGWAHDIAVTKIPSDLFRATNYIRNNSAVTDRVLSSNLDPLALIVALTERPAFLSREALYRNFRGNGGFGMEFAQRRLEFDRLSSFVNCDDLRSFGSRNNIQWFIKFPDDLETWKEGFLNCSNYVSGEFRVYDLRG